MFPAALLLAQPFLLRLALCSLLIQLALLPRQLGLQGTARLLTRRLHCLHSIDLLAEVTPWFLADGGLGVLASQRAVGDHRTSCPPLLLMSQLGVQRAVMGGLRTHCGQIWWAGGGSYRMPRTGLGLTRRMGRRVLCPIVPSSSAGRLGGGFQATAQPVPPLPTAPADQLLSPHRSLSPLLGCHSATACRSARLERTCRTVLKNICSSSSSGTASGTRRTEASQWR